MPRNQYIELDGPLFEPGMRAAFAGAVREGMAELSEDLEGVMAGVISGGGFVKTGSFLRSVDSIQRYRGPEEVGYIKIYPMDSWSGTITLGHNGAKTKKGKARMTVTSVDSSNNRPTRTWADRGERRGVKLRKGLNIFSRTATAGRNIDKQQFADKIAEALN